MLESEDQVWVAGKGPSGLFHVESLTIRVREAFLTGSEAHRRDTENASTPPTVGGERPRTDSGRPVTRAPSNCSSCGQDQGVEWIH